MSRHSAAASLRFLGAAGTVTGSRFLLRTAGATLLVDCGLFQGLKPLRLRNREPLPVAADEIDAVVLTHAHLDHSGYLPALVRQGFRGPVFATPNTLRLCEILLPDSGRLQEEDAAFANRKGFSRHRPALPLYSEAEAAEALERFRTVDFGKAFEAAPGVRAELRHAGHILGAASAHLTPQDGTWGGLLVSGDLGRPEHPLLCAPDPPPPAATVLVESTYGDRTHDDAPGLEAFADAIARTAERGGVVLIPAFAVDRTEGVLLHLKRLVAAGRIPDLPVYVDSPMALAALEVYRRAVEAGDPEIRPELAGAADALDFPSLVEARDTRASKAIHDAPLPAIIVSASGMMTGGRILHHMKRRLPDPRTCVLLVGFQAEGTRGRALQDGATHVKLHGRYVPVRAEVVNVPAFSVHADRGELLGWLGALERPPETAFVVHGEPGAAGALRDGIEAELGWNAVVPRADERVLLEPGP